MKLTSICCRSYEGGPYDFIEWDVKMGTISLLLSVKHLEDFINLPQTNRTLMPVRVKRASELGALAVATWPIVAVT